MHAMTYFGVYRTQNSMPASLRATEVSMGTQPWKRMNRDLL